MGNNDTFRMLELLIISACVPLSRGPVQTQSHHQMVPLAVFGARLASLRGNYLKYDWHRQDMVPSFMSDKPVSPLVSVLPEA